MSVEIVHDLSSWPRHPFTTLVILETYKEPEPYLSQMMNLYEKFTCSFGWHIYGMEPKERREYMIKNYDWNSWHEHMEYGR